MGIFVNPGNQGFEQIRKGIYVDKSGMISLINQRIETPKKLVCISRPRRFGKSFAAKMLSAYYDGSCDSRALFSDLQIGKEEDFTRYLNQFHVIYIDITSFLSRTNEAEKLVGLIQKCVIEELWREFPQCAFLTDYLPDALTRVVEETNKKFYIIIDEWDAIIREATENLAVQKEYLQLLRGLFKAGPFTDQIIAGAYMTGILPIKKYGTESALTDFSEYSMTDPAMFAEYVGFTEYEVQELCNRYQMSYEEMKRWYNGYQLMDDISIYSPNSVMAAIERRRFQNYWTSTETYESLRRYIAMNLDGLKDAVIRMIGGECVRIDTLGFQNDITTFRKKDDVLTLLVHLGYLVYHEKKRTVSIPNLEVSDSFRLAVEDSGWDALGTAIQDSMELVEQTIEGKTEFVALQLDRIHESTTSILEYNDENSLSCAITIAYYAAKMNYQIQRELPTGRGFADVVFIPNRNSDKPAMIVELKYDKDADSAIKQIKEKRYQGTLSEYQGNLLLVGINYDKKSKKHTCVIERRQE